VITPYKKRYRKIAMTGNTALVTLKVRDLLRSLSQPDFSKYRGCGRCRCLSLCTWIKRRLQITWNSAVGQTGF